MSTLVHTLTISSAPASKQTPLADPSAPVPTALPPTTATKTHPSAPVGNGSMQDGGKARLVFVGTATCISEWCGIRIMTDPNFLHAGDHVHFGPGVTGTRVTNAAFPIEQLPPVDAVVLSHFHADHFDQLVQEKLRKNLPIITTVHAQEHLVDANLGFTNVLGMDVWQSTRVVIDDFSGAKGLKPCLQVTATPGTHIAGIIGAINDAILHAIPPTNGHMLELGWEEPGKGVTNGYRIYISGDTLMVDDLNEIPKRYPDIDLLLIHLGGTTIPGPSAPLLMVTMDGKQGIQLVQLISPKVTIPIHFDDYDVFLSPRSDFEEQVKQAGLGEKVLYLDREESFAFGTLVISLHIMQLTIFSHDDKTYFMEIGQEMQLGDLTALVAAEAEEDMDDIELVYNGQKLQDATRTLASFGMTTETEAVQMDSKRLRASTSAAASTNPMDDMERTRLQILGDPSLMAQLRQMRPDLADAVMTHPTRFAELFRQDLANRQSVEVEKKKQQELWNADPYDVEAQRKIAEAIRQQQVLENMEHAMEYSPESFGNVTMLYIDVEVNGHKVKAFVDSGAQSTIISPDCAERCNIMRLLDTRFAGEARGVGTAKILGRIHSAQIKLGDLHLPVAFSVLEGRDVDLLFGLDMLKRHQACIDLGKNCLRIQGREVRFLSEHELPDKARRMGEEQVAEELGEAGATGKLPAGGVAPAVPNSASSSATRSSFPGTGATLASSTAVSSSAAGNAAASAVSAASFPEDDIQAIVNLGASRENAIQTLEAAGGNVDIAASMLFSW